MKRILILAAMFCAVATTAVAQNEEKEQAVRSLVSEGVKLYDEGRMEEALRKYDAALKIDGTDATAYYEKAYTLIRMGRSKEAKKVLEKSLKKCQPGELTMNYKLLADIIDDEGDSRKAIDYYITAFDSNENMPLTMRQSLYYNIGVSYTRLMNQEPDSCAEHANTAVNCFHQSLIINPQHPGSYYNFSHVMMDGCGKEQHGFSWALGMMGWYGVFGANHPMVGQLAELPDKWAAMGITQEEVDSMGPRTRLSYESVCEVAKKEPSEWGKLYDAYMYAIPKVAEGYTAEPVPLPLAKEDMHEDFLWPLYAKIVREGMLETFCHMIAVRDEKHYITNANWVTKNSEAVKKFTDMLAEGRYFDASLIEEQKHGRVPSVDSVASAEDAHARNEEMLLACKYYLKHYIGTEEMERTAKFIMSWAQASPDVNIKIGEGEAKWVSEQTMPYLVAYIAANTVILLAKETKDMTEDIYYDAVAATLWYYESNKDKTGTNDEFERLINLLNTDRDAFEKEVKGNFPVE